MANTIEVKNISKIFKITHGKEETLKGLVTKAFKEKKSYVEQFWALKNVSFNVKKGESLGIIGSNGSGKTTLLRVLARIINPDSGTIKVIGKVSTLFELGTGFHPELTGIENIYLNGSILGLTKKEIDKKLDDIISFSEMEKFIDTQLKFYSAGMQVRLAFSVAVNVAPEVLLVDEVLSVGDASFQEKSFTKFQEFKKIGATIVFISHDLGRIQEFCDRVIVMNKGQVYFEGSPQKAVLEYLRLNMEEHEKKKSESKFDYKTKAKEFKIKKVEFLDVSFKKREFFETGTSLTVRIYYQTNKEIVNPVIGIAFHRKEDGVHITGPNTKDSGFPIKKLNGDGFVDYKIRKIPMLSGTYLLTVGLFDYNVSFAYDFIDKGPSFKVASTEVNQSGIIKLDAEWSLGK